jgi:hypothetical protein
VKNVPKVEWTKVREFVKENAPYLLALLDESTKYFLSASEVRKMGGIGKGTDACYLSNDDVAVLVTAGLTVEVNGDAISNCRSFSVSEAVKHRRRWILHPIVLNDATEGTVAE